MGDDIRRVEFGLYRGGNFRECCVRRRNRSKGQRESSETAFADKRCGLWGHAGGSATGRALASAAHRS